MIINTVHLGSVCGTSTKSTSCVPFAFEELRNVLLYLSVHLLTHFLSFYFKNQIILFIVLFLFLLNLPNTQVSCYIHKQFNPIALRTAKTLWNFGCSECNRAKGCMFTILREATLPFYFFASFSFLFSEKGHFQREASASLGGNSFLESRPHIGMAS